MKNIGLILFLFVVAIGCKKSPYHGFSISKTGLNYKIEILGDEDLTLHDSDVVMYDLHILNSQNDSLFSGEVEQMYVSSVDSGMMELLGKLAVGDRAAAYMHSSKLKNIVSLPSQLVRIEVEVKDAMDYGAWLFYSKYPELLRDLEMEERVLLQQLLSQYSSDSIEVNGGMFIIHEVIGQGDFPQKGDEVITDYVVETAKNKVLDSTYERKIPFSYVIGQQDQVITGFDLGIRKMRKGGKATFIVPSILAFGSTGSSTGLAKEYETLIYHVEVLNVIQGDSLNPRSE